MSALNCPYREYGQRSEFTEKMEEWRSQKDAGCRVWESTKKWVRTLRLHECRLINPAAEKS